MIDRLLPKYTTSYKTSPTKSDEIFLQMLEHNIIKIEMPEDIFISSHLMMRIDQQIEAFSGSKNKVLMVFNGVEGYSQASKRYIYTKEHTCHYQSLALVLTKKGEKTILDKHYLQQFMQYSQSKEYYPKALFSNEHSAVKWLITN